MYLKNFHRYLGLVLCLVMLSISLTGTLLLWKKEYLWLTIEDARQSVDPSMLAQAIERIEASYTDGELTFVQLHSEDLALHKVFLTGRRYAWHNQEGAQLQVWQGNQRWEDWLLDLHHRFLLGNTIGLNIAGFGGLLLMPLLIAGILIWWPRRRTLRLSLLPKTRGRGALMRSHSNLGAVFMLPIFLLTLTGVILVYPVEARWVLLDKDRKDVTVTSKLSQAKNEGASAARDALGLPSWSAMFDLAYSRFPGSQIRSLRPASKKNQSRRVNVQQEDGWHRLGRSSIEVDRRGVLRTVDALKQAKRVRLFSFSYPLHTAKLGLVYKLIITIVGLAFSLICVLGLYSFAQSKRV